MKSWIRRGLLKLRSLSGAMSETRTIGRPRTTAALPPPNMCSACSAPSERRAVGAASRASPNSRARSRSGRSGSADLRGQTRRSRRRRKPGPASRHRSAAQRALAPSAHGFWQSLSFWRGLGLGPSAIAAALPSRRLPISRTAPDAPPPLLATLGQHERPAGLRRRGQSVRRQKPDDRAGRAARRRSEVLWNSGSFRPAAGRNRLA